MLLKRNAGNTTGARNKGLQFKIGIIAGQRSCFSQQN